MEKTKPIIIYISSDEGDDDVAAAGGGSWNDSDDDDDDDCVILEEDPFKPARVELNEKVGDDSDDLVVVSEQGQVACRDYPHPRHLCAKFPFATTPHESHCDKCHCYVCDTLAPCLHWKKGILAHCHANDKLETWRTSRENRNKNDQKKVEQVVSCAADAAVSTSPPLANQSRPLPQPELSSVTQNHVPSEESDNTVPTSSLSSTITLRQIIQEQPGCRQNTNSISSRFVSTPQDISNEFNNLNLGKANTDMLNQNDKPNSNPDSSMSYPAPVTVRSTGTHCQPSSNTRPTSRSTRTKKKVSTRA